MDILYVKAASKTSLNERLGRGERVLGTKYNHRGSNVLALVEQPDGTVVKIYARLDPFGTPIAKAYGVWNPRTRRVE